MIKTEFCNQIMIKKTNNGYIVMPDYVSGDYFEIKNIYVFESLPNLISFIDDWDNPDSFKVKK